jgi:hypothetical protein
MARHSLRLRKRKITSLPMQKRIKNLLFEEVLDKFEVDIRFLLHAARDCYRNRGLDTTRFTWNSSEDNGYEAEAFGMLRSLETLGVGTLSGGSSDTNAINLSQWFEKKKKEVLEEENFGGDNTCDLCLKHFGKDGAGRNAYSFRICPVTGLEVVNETQTF